MSFPRYPRYKDSGVEWFGDVPEDWDVTQLKRIVDPSRPITYGIVQAGPHTARGVPYIRPADMSDEAGVRDVHDLLRTSHEIAADYRRSTILEGDLVCSIGPSFGKVMITPPALNGANLTQGTARLAVRGVCSRFVFWVLRSAASLAQWESSVGGATFRALNLGPLAVTSVPVPTLEDQQAIAEFLDRETFKIDELIREQKHLIDLLVEKRLAVISHAVTCGLDPDAPMKPSGLEWMGDVPTHWNLVAVGKITLSRCDGPFGSGLKSEHYTDSGARVIRLQNLRDGYFAEADEAFIDLDYFREELIGHEVEAGDLLIAGLGDDRNTVGRACVAPGGIAPALVKADCFRFRLDCSGVRSEFAAAQLTAGSRADAGRLASGSTRSRIPLSVMATRKLALPPITEQTSIVNFIQVQDRTFSALIAEAERATALLQERRTALISAAVTGKIDVRNLAEAA